MQKRFFTSSLRQPKAYYQSEPFLNFLDPNEKSFLSQKYVTTPLISSLLLARHDPLVPHAHPRRHQGNRLRP